MAADPYQTPKIAVPVLANATRVPLLIFLTRASAYATLAMLPFVFTNDRTRHLLRTSAVPDRILETLWAAAQMGAPVGFLLTLVLVLYCCLFFTAEQLEQHPITLPVTSISPPLSMQQLA